MTKQQTVEWLWSQHAQLRCYPPPPLGQKNEQPTRVARVVEFWRNAGNPDDGKTLRDRNIEMREQSMPEKVDLYYI